MAGRQSWRYPQFPAADRQKPPEKPPHMAGVYRGKNYSYAIPLFFGVALLKIGLPPLKNSSIPPGSRPPAHGLPGRFRGATVNETQKAGGRPRRSVRHRWHRAIDGDLT